MLGFFKQKKVFEGAYWTSSWDLEPFKVRAISEAEARKLLAKEKDFRFVCVIKEEVEKMQQSEIYLRASKEVNRDMLALALMIFFGLCIGFSFNFYTLESVG